MPGGGAPQRGQSAGSRGCNLEVCHRKWGMQAGARSETKSRGVGWGPSCGMAEETGVSQVRHVLLLVAHQSRTEENSRSCTGKERIIVAALSLPAVLSC